MYLFDKFQIFTKISFQTFSTAQQVCSFLMEGTYRQKSMYIVFILKMITPLFISTFTHVTLLLSNTCIYDFLFFFLYLYFLLNLMVQYFLLIPINSYFYNNTGSLLHWIHLSRLQTCIDYAKNEALSMNTNTSCAN